MQTGSVNFTLHRTGKRCADHVAGKTQDSLPRADFSAHLQPTSSRPQESYSISLDQLWALVILRGCDKGLAASESKALALQ